MFAPAYVGRKDGAKPTIALYFVLLLQRFPVSDRG
jgi:hypothetical protein